MLGRSLINAVTKSALPGRTLKYEVMVQVDGRWTIDCLMDDEAQAIARAKALLAEEKNQRAKVVRQRSMASGFTTEKPIFEEERVATKKEIGLSATIKEAPVCESYEDLFKLDARAVIGRMLREFLDKLVVTPTELLHNYGYMKKLDASGSLITGAVYQVAQAQASGAGGTAKGRAEVLQGLVNQAMAMARNAAAEKDRKLTLKPGGFAALLRHAEAKYVAGERRHAILVALAEFLAGSRSFGQKFEQVAALVDEAVDPAGIALLDSLVADIHGSGVFVQDLLGAQPTLGGALGVLADLVTKRIAAEPPRASDTLKLVARLIHAHDLPETRAVLLDRLKRELVGTKPLNKIEPAKEREALRELEAKLRGADGQIVGGAETEAALGKRREAVRKAILERAGVSV